MREFILGTDWWDDCDDAVALRILLRSTKINETRLIGVGINACMEYSAASVEGFMNLEGVSGIPVGIDITGTDYGGVAPYQKTLAAHSVNIKKNSDAEDAVKLYRRVIANADSKVEIIEIGFLTVIAAALKSGADEFYGGDGVSLFKEKVSKVWIMAGNWSADGGLENNIIRTPRTIAAARDLLALCPVPVTFLGYEVGEDVITGGKLDKSDFLHRVMKEHGSEGGRSSWDPMTALLAVIGDEEKAGYSLIRGRAEVDPLSGANHFIPFKNGPHGYVMKKYGNGYYRDLIDERIK